MLFFIIAFICCPLLIIIALILKKSVRIQEQLQRLEEQQKQLLQANSLLKVEKEALLSRQAELDRELANAQKNSAQKQQQLDQYAARQFEFHIIKFGRISAWGSPAYTISVDALGNVLYQGKEAVRRMGFYQWKIFRKRINNLNNVIKKSRFFEIEETTYQSAIDNVSGVVIEIYLKNGMHQRIQYDHAADYPIDLGFLERKLDIILGTKKLWLFWSQNIVQFSFKGNFSYRVQFIANQGVLYTIHGKDYFSTDYYTEWSELDAIVQKHEMEWLEATNESYRNHPKNSMWVELESGFRFLITPHKNPEAYQAIVALTDEYANDIQAQAAENEEEA